MKLEDLTNKIFNSWEVISYSNKSKWKCKCLECNEFYEVRSSELKSGKSKKCRNCFYNSRLDDLKNKIFNDWIVIEYDLKLKKWKCKCLCGNISYVYSDNLKNNSSKRCRKCADSKKIEDLSGQKIGNWKVLYRTESEDYPRFVCICDCGNKSKVLYKNLKNGSSTKCKECGIKYRRTLNSGGRDKRSHELGYMYLIKLNINDDIAYKIGVTRNIEKRFIGEINRYNPEILYINNEKLINLYKKEKLILLNYENYKYISKYKFHGYTELFNSDLPLKKIKNYFI